ncbi:TPA: hypothetical protein L5W85_006049 [Pseudomonas aeruginosa]|uniref:hypothetical protein n=1 Tax=Pseudomonas aeruginosa TaxID=287 RepID=UPI0006899CA1|nr:hypothetical protein [Pseudomonas aeruginosa]HCL3090180.1 hypothetical protein [Pseudomonas aeruginosa 1BAE]ASD10590.1 hypothetical protein CD800_16395 [Pseudomonas aeruginosa]EIU6916679.1 hypothetical protein [Pseudomonas aeruginosa]EKI0101352.1 hypothetical protein [Pseudomonas aeruginosa]EKW9850204.1 hypothetical protein [Pseudomonas aeruginosa]
MSIDWSKAPEGCIGAFARIISKTAFFVFSKRPSDYMSREGYEGEGEDGPYHVFSEYWEWIDKPWDGQGLPPTGLLVEWKAGLDHEWRRVTVLAYANGDAWLQPEDGGSFIVGNPANFRRIRTPEQIAAEEREKAVGDMAMSIQGVPYQYPTLYALFDAGYRRQEEGK